MKFFNTAGPCKPERNYMIPATRRLAAEGVYDLIEQGGYFVLHAPRQVGKTTAMAELARELTASGKYISAVVSMEVGAREQDIGVAETAILANWRMALNHFLPADLRPPEWPDGPERQRISQVLSFWAQNAPRPLVLFLDEIDSLEDETLISVLRQLRSGYPFRPESFPASLAVIGLRDVRDYKVLSGGNDRLGTPSPFNIAVRSLTIQDFTADEVRELLTQHTAETGQFFTDETLQLVFDLTQGQPWLVNALAKTVVEDVVKDRLLAITPEHINQAKEIIIQRRPTHLDQLTHKLTEERVRRVIEPILSGGSLENMPDEDLQYVSDLGLIRRLNGFGAEIANRIYKEVLPRALTTVTSASIPKLKPTWLNADGSLNADKLLESFLDFWRQHGEPLLRSAPYHEIAPHLVLLRSAPYHEIAPHLVMMAFLQRVINGGGSLEREYAIGSDRMDLFLRYGLTRLAIELKVWRDGRPDPLKRGLEQLDEYLNGLNLDSGWLVIFDKRSDQSPISERTSTEMAVSPAARRITVIRA